MRALRLLAGLAFLVVACSETPPATTSPTPTASVDIKRTKLDISYASLSDQDVHKVSSKKILEGAITALNAEIKKTGGKGDRKSTRLNSSHLVISYAVFCLKKKTE